MAKITFISLKKSTTKPISFNPVSLFIDLTKHVYQRSIVRKRMAWTERQFSQLSSRRICTKNFEKILKMKYLFLIFNTVDKDTGWSYNTLNNNRQRNISGTTDVIFPSSSFQIAEKLIELNVIYVFVSLIQHKYWQNEIYWFV